MKKFLTILSASIIILFALVGCSSIDIDLSEGYSINYDGIDGEGSLFISKNVNKILNNLDVKDEKYTQVLAFVQTVQYTTSENMNLSNGQTITVKCLYDEALAEEAGINPIFKEKEIQIPEDTFLVIRELTEDEVFNDVVINAEGVYPNLNLYASYAKTNSITELLYLNIINTDYEKNTVTVEASMSYSTINYDLGVSLKKPLTKEIEIGTYSKYINSLDQIPKTDKEKILKQANDVVIAYLEQEKSNSPSKVYFGGYWENRENLAKRKYKDVTLHKVYFLSVKDGIDLSYNPIYNQTIFIYKLTAINHENEIGYPVYIPVFLNNIVKLKNGELDYQIGKIDIFRSNVATTDADYKSIFINAHIDKYDTNIINAAEF